jgi:hypothetical protein
MLRAVAVLVGALLATGCTTIEVAPARHNIGQTTDFGKETIVSVGDVIFGQFDYRAVNGAILLEDLNAGYQATTIKAPVGYTLIESRINNQPSYCSTTPIIYNIFGSPALHACFFDRDNDKRFEAVIPAQADNWGDKQITPVSYELTQINSSGKGFKYELLYNGISSNTLNITYREFVDQMARPAFQQDLTYTVSGTGPTDIVFRGARITVYKADNSSVRFVVHSGVRK